MEYPFAVEACTLETRLALLGRQLRVLTDSPRIAEILGDVFASRHFQAGEGEPETTLYCAVDCETPWTVAMADARAVHVARPSTRERLRFELFEWTPEGATPDGFFSYDVAYPEPSLDTTLELYASHFQRLILQAGMRGQEGLQVVHAGALAVSDRGALIFAPTMGGKSTLTLAATLEGARFLSDDLAAVDLARGLILPFPRAARLRAPACDLVPEFRNFTRGVTIDVGGETRYYFHPESVRPEALGETVPLTHVLRLRAFGEQPKLTPAPAAEMAFTCVEADCFTPGEGSLGMVWKWAALLQTATCADLVAGPPVATARRLLDFLAHDA
jgi:hypothetical protein